MQPAQIDKNHNYLVVVAGIIINYNYHIVLAGGKVT
jgi:hypothetical protein